MVGDRDRVLDGLRGAAALAVVYYHYVFLTGLSARPGGGHAGVLIFFALSGFLITQILWRTETNSWATYLRFVRRRLVRLYPALAGMVIVSGPLMAWVGPDSVLDVGRAALIVLSQSTALLHVLGVTPAPGWLHAWSLTVEWVFYLLWPIGLTWLRRRQISARGAARAAVTAAAVLYLAALPLSPKDFYYLPVANLTVMLVGAWAALRRAADERGERAGRERPLVDFAFLIFVLMVFLPSSTTGVWLYRVTIFPVSVAVAFYIIDRRPRDGGLAARVLGSRAMQAVGVASYSLYLWHLPVLWIVWWGLPENPAVTRTLMALVALPLPVWVSFRYLEKPWLGLSARGAQPLLRARAVAAPSAALDA